MKAGSEKTNRASRALAVRFTTLIASASLMTSASAQCQYSVAVWSAAQCGSHPPNGYTGTGLNDLGAWCGYRMMCYPEEGDGWLPIYCPPGGMPQVLVVPAGASDDGARANAVNNSGVVVGYMSVGEFSEYQHGVIWRPDGSHEVIPPLGGVGNSVAFDINSTGVIVGANNVYPYVLDDGVMTTISVAPFAMGVGWRISESGLVTGTAGNENTTGRAFRWLGSEVEFLEPVCGYSATSGYDINSSGSVVGFSRIVISGQIYTYPTLWIDGVPIALPLLPGYTTGHAGCINDSGVIGGWMKGPDSQHPTRAVIWVDSEIHLVTDLVLPDSPPLGIPISVNGSGQILSGGGPRIASASLVTACDLNGDCAVDGEDLGVLLSSWGAADFDPRCDLNGDGTVDGFDLGTLLGEWTAMK